jgi:Flp pilus assembly protein TadG
MRRTRRKHPRYGERGTAIPEFAVVLPLLLFLGVVVFEGAAMIRTHQVLNNAAREGARFAVLEEMEPAQLQQVVVTYAALNDVEIEPAEVAVDQQQSIPGPDGALMSSSVVTVTHQYELEILPNIPGFSPTNSFTLVGRAEFRNFF